MKNNNTNIKNKHHLTKTIAVLLSLSLAISSINVGVAKADQSPALKVVNDDASEEAKTLLSLIKECVKYGIDTSKLNNLQPLPPALWKRELISFSEVIDFSEQHVEQRSLHGKM